MFGNRGGTLVLLAALAYAFTHMPALSAKPSSADAEALRATLTEVEPGCECSGWWAARNDLRRRIGEQTTSAIVVLVPDPDDSHFGAATDGVLAAISTAAGAAGFSLERYWVPWDPPQPQGQRDQKPPDCAPSCRERPPGFMLLRNAEAPLSGDPSRGPSMDHVAVLLVGETPTVGPSTSALKAAVETACLAPGAAPLRIVGPVFSGSMRVLADQLRFSIALKDETCRKPLAIVTGSASGSWWALTRLAAASGGWFRSATQSSRAIVEAVLDHVYRMGISPREVAVLLEDNTDYGNSVKYALQGDPHVPTHGPPFDGLILPFPMHLARVRDEMDAARVRDRKNGTLDLPRAMLGLQADTGREPRMDALPAFSGASMNHDEQVLASAMAALTRQRTRAVGVFATDVRDKRFLTEKVREYLPSALVFTSGSDILLAYPEERGSLTGMVVGSSYPLFVDAQAWMADAPRHARVQFADEHAQGIYNAFLYQLAAFGTAELTPGVTADARDAWWNRTGGHLLDVGCPYLRDERSHSPAVWVSAVGRTEPWPLRVFCAEPDPGGASAPTERDTLAQRNARSMRLPKPGEIDPAVWEDDRYAAPVVLGMTAPPASSPSPPRLRPPRASPGFRFGFLVASIVSGLVGASYLIGRLKFRNDWILSSTSGGSGRTTGVGAWFVPAGNPHDRTQAAWSAVLLTTLLGITLTFMVLSGGPADIAAALDPEGVPRLLAPLSRELAHPETVRIVSLLASLLCSGLAFVAAALAWGALFRPVTCDTARPRQRIDRVLASAGTAAGAVVAGGALLLLARGILAPWLFAPQEEGGRNAILWLQRASQFGNGISPVLPLVFLGTAIALLAVERLHRLALVRAYGSMTPTFFERFTGASLPTAGALDADILRWVTSPALPWRWMTYSSLVVVVSGLALWRMRISSLDPGLDRAFILAFVIVLWSIAARAYRARILWRTFRRALEALSRHPLGASFKRMHQFFSVERLRRFLFSPPKVADLAAVNRLLCDASLCTGGPACTHRAPLEHLERDVWQDPRFHELQRTAASMASDLAPGWSAHSSPEQTSHAVIDFVAAQATLTIFWLVLVVRNLLAYTVLATVALAAALATYRYEPHRFLLLGVWTVGAFVTVAVVRFFTQLDRSEVMSWIATTRPGRLSFDHNIVMQVLGFALVPILAFIAFEFPGTSDWLFRWMNPFLNAVK